MYLVPLALFYFGKGRGYYMAAAYPMLHGDGRGGRRALARSAAPVGPPHRQSRLLLGPRRLSAPTSAPSLFRSQPADRSATSRSSTTATCAKRSAGTELVKTVAGIRDSLPPDQQAHLGITTGNYGEYGAIEILGPAYGLPQPIGTTNSEWLRGYPTPPPTTIIVLGLSRRAGRLTSSPTAVSPATTATPKASGTKRASTIPTSSSAARRAYPGPSSGRTIRTSVELMPNQYSSTATR